MNVVKIKGKYLFPAVPALSFTIPKTTWYNISKKVCQWFFESNVVPKEVEDDVVVINIAKTRPNVNHKGDVFRDNIE